MKTSFQFALVVFVFLTALSTCKFRDGSSDVSDVGRAPEPDSPSLRDFVEECEKELGPLPMFASDASTISCLDEETFQTIPITFTGNSGTHELNDISAINWMRQECDRPAWLPNSLRGEGGSGCVPFSRVGRWTTPSRTTWIVMCRRYGLYPKNDVHFDDINMIGHNPKTGATCFLNNRDPGMVLANGSQMPNPKSARGKDFWYSAYEMQSNQCMACHSSDPFIHSPWLDQVKTKSGDYLVPRMGSDPDYELGNLNRPYRIINREFLNHELQLGGNAGPLGYWAQPKHLSEPLINETCGQCHRVGNRENCELLTPYSAGKGLIKKYQTEFASLHPYMPEGGPYSALDGQKFAAAFKRIDDCCASSQGPITGLSSKQNCNWVEIPSK